MWKCSDVDPAPYNYQVWGLSSSLFFSIQGTNLAINYSVRLQYKGDCNISIFRGFYTPAVFLFLFKLKCKKNNLCCMLFICDAKKLFLEIFISHFNIDAFLSSSFKLSALSIQSLNVTVLNRESLIS